MTKPTTILILIILSLLCLNPACYAKVRYVNTASSGGDGTTNATSGPHAAYASLYDWQADEHDIPLTEPMIVYCEGTAADTRSVGIADWTGNSATNYIKITTTHANRHNGKWDDTKYRLQVSGVTSLAIREGFVRCEGLQLHLPNPTVDYRQLVLLSNDVSDGEEIHFSNSILKMSNISGDYRYGIRGQWCTSGTRTVKIWNNIIYDINHPSNTHFYGIIIQNGWNAYLYNNTVINCVEGIKGDSSIAKNNITQDCSDGFTGSFTSSDYNISDIAGDTTGISSSYQEGTALTVTFADEANDDYHLNPSDSNAKDQGENLSAIFSDDIDGQTRSWGGAGGAWDIGADEVVEIGLRIGGY